MRGLQNRLAFQLDFFGDLKSDFLATVNDPDVDFFEMTVNNFRIPAIEGGLCPRGNDCYDKTTTYYETCRDLSELDGVQMIANAPLIEGGDIANPELHHFVVWGCADRLSFGCCPSQLSCMTCRVPWPCTSPFHVGRAVNPRARDRKSFCRVGLNLVLGVVTIPPTVGADKENSFTVGLRALWNLSSPRRPEWRSAKRGFARASRYRSHHDLRRGTVPCVEISRDRSLAATVAPAFMPSDASSICV